MAKRGRKPGQKTRVSPQTARVRALAASLGARGLSIAEVRRKLAEKGHEVPRSTVGLWLKQAREQGREAPAAVGAVADQMLEEPEPEVAVDGLTDVELDTEIREVVAWLRTARTGKNVMDYQRLVKVLPDLVRAREARRPPAAPDPNADPANVEARDLVRARLMAEIEAVESGGEASTRGAA